MSTEIANDFATKNYHEILLKSEEALDYLYNRGLKKEVLIQSSIGYADGNVSMVGLLRSNGLQADHLATLDGRADYFKHRIVMPLVSLGHTRFFTSRGMPGKLPIHLHQRGKIEHFFNEDVLYGAKYVTIVESPICCLTLKQNGVNAIARLGNFSGDIDKIGKDCVVYIVPDIDSHKAGEKEAIRLGAVLKQRGYNVKIVYLSDDYSKKTDVNSYFLTHTLSDFREIFKSAVDIYKHKKVEGISLLEEIKKIEKKKIKSTLEHEIGDDLRFAKFLKIEDEIKRYCDLTEFGGLYKCLCPFHEDKDPSLTVYPESKSWFCYSCKIGGDIIEFVKRIEEVDFKSALDIIIRRNKNENKD